VTDLDGPVHWVEFGEETDAARPPIVFVHGLGGSHLNWVLVGPALGSQRRAIAIDLPGFGLSSGAGRECSVQSNAEVLLRFLDSVVGVPAILVGNSMGGAVSLLATQARPDAVAGLVLVDPALPMSAGRADSRVAGGLLLSLAPGVGEVALRLLASRESARRSVERVINVCFADPTRARPDVIDAAVALAEYRRSVPGSDRSLMLASRSLVRLLARPAAYWAVMDSIAVPTVLIHGEADRLVPIRAARRAAARYPRWDSVFLPGVGHTPQLEVPDVFTAAVKEWLVGQSRLGTR